MPGGNASPTWPGPAPAMTSEEWFNILPEHAHERGDHDEPIFWPETVCGGCRWVYCHRADGGGGRRSRRLPEPRADRHGRTHAGRRWQDHAALAFDIEL